MRMDRQYKVGNFIYTLRAEKGLTQKELGDLLGVTNKAVSKWENGSAIPRVQLLPKLAEILGCTQEELFLGGYLRGKGEQHPTPTAEYVSVVERCNQCRHAPQRRCFSEKRKMTCQRCGAALQFAAPYRIWRRVLSGVLLLAILLLCRWWSMALTMYIFANGFPTAEQAILHGQLLAAFPHLKTLAWLAIAAIFLFGGGAYLLLHHLLIRKLLDRRASYDITSYPHAEDGKIVF